MNADEKLEELGKCHDALKHARLALHLREPDQRVCGVLVNDTEAREIKDVLLRSLDRQLVETRQEILWTLGVEEAADETD